MPEAARRYARSEAILNRVALEVEQARKVAIPGVLEYQLKPTEGGKKEKPIVVSNNPFAPARGSMNMGIGLRAVFNDCGMTFDNTSRNGNRAPFKFSGPWGFRAPEGIKQAPDTPEAEGSDPMATKWNFDADYYTSCNCDWGCPRNFNARPTQGNCHGIGAWRIRKERFGNTKLDGVAVAAAYFFPGPVEQGNGIRRLYIDRRATPEQRKAIEAINSGQHGGGIFEIFPKLVAKTYPTMITDIDFRLEGPQAHIKIEDILEAESEALTYPDGSVILPKFFLPHGIEFKEALSTNTKRWWIRDHDLLASHENKYGAVSTVRFTNEGCVA